MYEHMEILPKYKLKMPQGANKNINKHNGTQPKQDDNSLILHIYIIIRKALS